MAGKLPINVVGIRQAVNASTPGPIVREHKGTVRFMADSITGPVGIEDRRVWVTLSLEDVAGLIGALPAVMFDEETWAALTQLHRFLKANPEETDGNAR